MKRLNYLMNGLAALALIVLFAQCAGNTDKQTTSAPAQAGGLSEMGGGPGERAGAAVDEPHFQALESGRSDAVATDQSSLAWYMTQNPGR